ncbi:MAG: SDR family NAD(P)-dependent oxidoreductase [Microcoleus sp. SIO2G3]|nr:SDR family NAD(P)-dependent oxidoreductase [Microcoleus sp. SIO2G3]
MMQPLKDKIALVAGATRGAGRGIAVELGAAGATVYVTGRTTRTQRSEYNRPETIEETADLVNQVGGQGIAVPVDHLDPVQVQALVGRIESEQARLDVLVNDIGAEYLVELLNKPVWEFSLDRGLRMLRLAIDTHIITSHFALPLLIKNPGGLVVEITDGTAEYNDKNYRSSLFYALAKTSVIRIAWALAQELQPYHCTAVALTPGWLRSEMMLDHFGVSEANWHDATAKEPHFVISESPIKSSAGP